MSETTKPSDREIIHKALDYAERHLRPKGREELENGVRDFLRNAKPSPPIQPLKGE